MKKNRAAVILPCNLHWAPYYYRYEKELLNRQTDFDLILWNRENIHETSKGNIVQLKLKDDCNSGNPLKIWKCLRFAEFVKNYWIDGINEDQAFNRCGFVYEEGSLVFQGFRGNHIHIPADMHIINSPEYMEWFWICL